MKILKYLFFIIVIAFAVAKFTVPNKERLEAYAVKENGVDSLKTATDIIMHSFYADATIYYSKKNIDPEAKYAVATKTENYIGLFGTFFRVK